MSGSSIHGAVVVAMLSTACGGENGPTAPSTAAAVFTPGGYLLQVSALDGDAGCAPSPSTGVKTRTTGLALTRAGDEWVGRSVDPTKGDLVIRIREQASSGAVVAVTGAATGTGVTAVSPDGSPALAVVLADVTLRGDAVVGQRQAFGALTGSMTFTENSAAPVHCTSGSWRLHASP